MIPIPSKIIVIWISVTLFLTGIIQFSTPYIIGADGFLHGRIATQMIHSGFLSSLPQAHFSWMSVKFSDKDFLYHIYQIPFISLFGYMSGSKIGAFVATGFLFIVSSVVAKVYVKNNSWLLVSVGLFLSHAFLRDTAEARPFIFAIALTIIGVHVFIQRKTKLLFLIALIYSTMHVSAWVLPVLVSILVFVDWLHGTQTKVHYIGCAVLGFIFGQLIHPNFPNNIYFFYLNGIQVPLMALSTGVLELGAELFPVATRDIFTMYPMLVFSFGVLVFGHLFIPVKSRRETILWLAAAGVFMFLGAVSKRNITHAYPLVLIAVSLSIDGLLRGLSELKRVSREKLISIGIFGTLVFMVFSLFITVQSLRTSLFSEHVYAAHYISMANQLRHHVPEGKRIFHTNWSDSQYFIGLAPEFEYLVTLDPIYMYDYDAELYLLYRMISHGQHPEPAKALRENFGTQYGYAGKNYFSVFIDQIRTNNDFRIISEDALGVLFEVNGAEYQ